MPNQKQIPGDQITITPIYNEDESALKEIIMEIKNQAEEDFSWLNNSENAGKILHVDLATLYKAMAGRSIKTLGELKKIWIEKRHDIETYFENNALPNLKQTNQIKDYLDKLFNSLSQDEEQKKQLNHINRFFYQYLIAHQHDPELIELLRTKNYKALVNNVSLTYERMLDEASKDINSELKQKNSDLNPQIILHHYNQLQLFSANRKSVDPNDKNFFASEISSKFLEHTLTLERTQYSLRFHNLANASINVNQENGITKFNIRFTQKTSSETAKFAKNVSKANRLDTSILGKHQNIPSLHEKAQLTITHYTNAIEFMVMISAFSSSNKSTPTIYINSSLSGNRAELLVMYGTLLARGIETKWLPASSFNPDIDLPIVQEAKRKELQRLTEAANQSAKTVYEEHVTQERNKAQQANNGAANPPSFKSFEEIKIKAEEVEGQKPQTPKPR